MWERWFCRVLLLQSGIFYRSFRCWIHFELASVYGTGDGLPMENDGWKMDQRPGILRKYVLYGPGPFGENLSLTVFGICML